MSSDSTTSGESKNDVAVDLIRDTLDREEVFLDLVTTSPGVDAVAVCTKFIPIYDPEADLMALGFANFLVKDLHHIPLPRRIDHDACYMSSTFIENIFTTSINIIR